LLVESKLAVSGSEKYEGEKASVPVCDSPVPILLIVQVPVEVRDERLSDSVLLS